MNGDHAEDFHGVREKGHDATWSQSNRILSKGAGFPFLSISTMISSTQDDVALSNYSSPHSYEISSGVNENLKQN